MEDQFLTFFFCYICLWNQIVEVFLKFFFEVFFYILKFSVLLFSMYFMVSDLSVALWFNLNWFYVCESMEPVSHIYKLLSSFYNTICWRGFPSSILSTQLLHNKLSHYIPKDIHWSLSFDPLVYQCNLIPEVFCFDCCSFKFS